MKSFFLTFEGIDFSGKSVQAKMLLERLRQEKQDVLYLREPGGTAISERIREILLDTRHAEMHARTEYLLYSAARAQIVEQVIRPALKQKKIVICDRYADSSTAYQGFGRNLNLNMIVKINKFATAALKPDVTVLLDISPKTARQRRQLAGLPTDRLEGEKSDFHHRVRNGYLQMVQQEPERFLVIDGEKQPEDIHQEIWQYIKRKFQ